VERKVVKLFKPFIGLLTMMGLFVLEPEAVTGAHFQLPFPPNLNICDYLVHVQIRGVHAQPGDEVGFFDRNGGLCGMAVVTTAEYVIAHLYGDEPATAEREGPLEGEPLTVRIWEAGRATEWKNGCIVLAAGAPLGYYTASVIPPVWSSGMGYVLHIEAPPPADLNGDCDITIADAILSLRIISAVSEPSVSPTWAGVDGNRQIGLREAVYILQTVAGIRR
jgi:hypothetical protein